jgi:hypothetical protein
MDTNFFPDAITMAWLHISAKINQKLTFWTPLAANRTPNRIPIRTQNRTCRQTLNKAYKMFTCGLTTCFTLTIYISTHFHFFI